MKLVWSDTFQLLSAMNPNLSPQVATGMFGGPRTVLGTYDRSTAAQTSGIRNRQAIMRNTTSVRTKLAGYVLNEGLVAAGKLSALTKNEYAADGLESMGQATDAHYSNDTVGSMLHFTDALHHYKHAVRDAMVQDPHDTEGTHKLLGKHLEALHLAHAMHQAAWLEPITGMDQ